jgi:Flp pilus assembly protein TadG
MANWIRRRKGSALVMFTLMLPTVILPMVGLAIDGTMLFMVKSKLSAAVDAGAIGAAQSLSSGMDLSSQRETAMRTAQQFVTANFPNNYWNSSNVRFGTVQVVEETKRRVVTLKASVDVPLLFMRIFGKDKQTVTAEGQAARRDVRMILVLDRSNSMAGSMDALRSAATYFVSRFAEGRDEVGLVVYGTTAIVAFPERVVGVAGTGPASNFKSKTPNNVTSLIQGTNECCGTGIAEALYLAWEELKKNPKPGALNLVVLFTDGQPSAFTVYANNPSENIIRSTSQCAYKNAASPKMIGAFTLLGQYNSGTSARGLYRDMQTTLNGTAPDVKRWIATMGPTNTEGGYGSDLSSPTRGCLAIDNPDASIDTDIAFLPTRDAFGNRTDSAAVTDAKYYSGARNPYAVKYNYQIYLASWSAADDAAQRIRNDADLSPTIYTIGLTNQVDDVLMRRIANVNHSTNHSFDSSKAIGKYIKAPTTAELGSAFESVAAEILRLTF